MSFHASRLAVSTLLILIQRGLFLAPAASALQALQPGMTAPDFSLRAISGETKSFAEVRGEKLTILIFWSTWSSKSEQALARLEKLRKKYRDQGLSIIGVNADGQRFPAETIAEIKEVRDRLGIGFPMLVDHGLVAFHDYGVVALPSTVIMDRERVIRYELPGYPLAGSEEMVDFVVAAFGENRQPVSAGKGGHQPNQNARRFYAMGETALRSKLTAGTAEAWFRKAGEADPAFALPHLRLAEICLRRGETALAQGEFRETLAREPGNPVALCESGMILVNEGKSGEGAALLEAGRQAQEPYFPCYYYAGYAYGKEGRLADAKKMFDEAGKSEPLDHRLFVYQGKLFEGQNDLTKALAAYKRGLEAILRLD
ncbi:MAG: redoxin domain-containing protein [Geobacteraceae bacterium]|nr:redoxin domain-containing protein [Geobacteraceae bacterium]